MIREFESPSFVRTLFLLVSVAVVGIFLVVGTIEGSVPIADQILRLLR
jgi:hypothetical protein